MSDDASHEDFRETGAEAAAYEPVVAAVIAAGTWKRGTPAGQPEWRALCELNGRPMLAYVMDALAGADRVTETVIVGPPDLSRHFPDATRLDASNRLTENVLTAARYATGRGRLLLVGSDVPLLTSAAVDGFLNLCAGSEARFMYPVVERQVMDAAYSGMKRTWVPLKDGCYTGGNLILADPAFLTEVEPLVGKIYAARKSPLGLAQILGWELLVRLLLTAGLRLPLLDLPRAEALVGRALGAKVAGAPVPFPEIGADLDSEDEIAFYEEMLRGQRD